TDRLSERNQQLAETTDRLSERDQQLAETTDRLSERNQQLADLLLELSVQQATSKELSSQIDELLNSNSWKITRPLRSIKKIF
ncbi:MAG: hypothetical protein K8R67_16005, partial [Desulfobacteraceae bacterium]|nr:hypothetical protein [Desulfobacteraceae bacterium]